MGATGAMGQYIVPLLAGMGFQVDAVALDAKEYPFPNVRGIAADCKDFKVRRELLANNYDGIVDFMAYNSAEISWYIPDLLASAGHYIFLSSYRIYANEEVPIKETSPRLKEATKDILLENSDDYCIYKARGENVVRAIGNKNWTIVRPAVTYSFMRYQLVTLEAPCTVGRALAGKKVVLPVQAKDIQGTMSWAGDVAEMIAKLLFNEKALEGTFSVSTAEHHSWGEIADYYKDICGLESVWVDKEDYLRIFGNFIPCRWQLEYDRLFNRIIDNSAVLEATGMKQENLRPLYDGLKYEISRCPASFAEISAEDNWNKSMDRYLEGVKG